MALFTKQSKKRLLIGIESYQNNDTTYLILPNDFLLESGIEGECGIMCFSLEYAKQCLGV